VNVEQELISYIVVSGEKDLTIPRQYFLDDAAAAAYTWISDFCDEYGEAPTPTALLTQFPDFSLTEEFSGPPDFLRDKLFHNYRRAILQVGISAVDDALGEDDFDKALAALAQTTNAVLATQSDDGVIDGAATVRERLDDYLNASSNDGLLGKSTGLTFLDEATQGLQPTQLIVITGLAKSCKTAITIEIMRSVWADGWTPLMISFEMSSRQIFQRWDGFTAGINPRRLRSGELSDTEKWRLREKLLAFEGKHPFVIADDRSSVMTVSGIRGKVQQLKPDCLFVDGAYFLTDEISRETQTPIALTNISRGLKQLAMICEIPVVITTQALPNKVGRGNKLGMYSGGYTSAWPQDADVLMGTAADEELEGVYHVPILASRNSMPTENILRVSWDPPVIEEVPRVDDGLPAV
jgi:hypothetical protein